MYAGGAGYLIFALCLQFVAGDLPLEACPWFGGARLEVAMLKDMDDDGRPIPTLLHGGGIRPIAMGEVLWKLVGKVVCKQRGPAFRVHFWCPDTLREEETTAL
jgi:hypothetical protein